MRRPRRLRLVWLCFVTTTAASCSGNFLSRLSLAPSPHDQYADRLRTARLEQTAMVRDWLQRSADALARPVAATLPMRESGYFPADQPSAVAYRFELQRGRRFSVEITYESTDAAQLFVDLFEERGAAAPQRIASLIEGTVLTADVPRDGAYLLRVQPELLRSGRYAIVQRTLASLIFPVSGLTPAAVQSEFGAERDAGRREHQGVDIFAPRNTPVVAVASGLAHPDTNTLGGTVIWLRDFRSGRSYYYAHLSRWAFEHATAVAPGDTVGYVGNSGNARTTPPHLHFGIYEGDAIDPFPFIRADDPPPPPVASGDRLATLVRVAGSRTTMRSGPARNTATSAELSRDTIARVLGVTSRMLRVELPDRSFGYVDDSAMRPATSALRERRLQQDAALRERPLAEAPMILSVAAQTAVEVLGVSGTFEFVKIPNGTLGWLEP